MFFMQGPFNYCNAFERFFGSTQDCSLPFACGEKPPDTFDIELRRLCSRDFDTLLRLKDNVISGYLNLSKTDGWHEGGDPRLGASFTRYILFQYFFQNKAHLGGNAVVFEKAVNAFNSCEDLLTSLEGLHPKRSRICHDSSVMGWQEHAVSHLIGNLGSTYIASKPFFEILVNSARHSSVDTVCKPFFISVHANEEEVEKRRRVLNSLLQVPGSIAQVSFYASDLTKPEDFLKMHQKKLGPNSTRLLKGLIYLQNVTLYGQKVGNCWIKQPMRSLLSTLYVELISNRHDLTPADAWKEATGLYKDIQCSVAIPLVKELIEQSVVVPEMKRTALVALEKQKQL